VGVCLAGPDPLSAGPAAPAFLRRTTGGVTIQLRVQPKACRTLLAAAPGGALKAAVTEVPEDGKANEALSIAGEPAALAGKITEWARKNG
jgi:hypothetical protein